MAAPEGYSPTSLARMFVNMTRDGNSNIMAWEQRFDNMTVTCGDFHQVLTEKVIIVPEYPAINVYDDTIGTGLSVEFIPFDTDDMDVTWSLLDSAAALPLVNLEVNPVNPNQARLIAKGLTGTVSVIATTTQGGIADTLEMPIKDVISERVKIVGDTLLSQNNSYVFTADIYPGNTNDKSVDWASENPAIASIDADGVVTGKAVGKTFITVRTLDGGDARDTMAVEVVYKPLERIELRGARRMFFNQTIASIDTFKITPILYPSDASDKQITWTSDDIDVATVRADSVAITGAGKAAIKASISGLFGTMEEFYYIEVDEACPYDGFDDFEDYAVDSKSLFQRRIDTRGGVDTMGRVEFEQSQVLQARGTGTGSRIGAMPLVDSIVGEVINISFDWYPNISMGHRCVLSIRQDPSGREPNYNISGVQPVDKNFLTLSYYTVLAQSDTVARDSVYFGYHIGDYSYEISSLNGWPEGTHLPNLTALNRWYTVNASINTVTKTLSFSIHERGNRDKGHSVEDLDMDGFNEEEEMSVGALFAIGYRPSGTLNMRQAIDNFTYKLTPAPPTVIVTFDLDGGIYNGSTTNPERRVELNKTFAHRFPVVTKDFHDFTGWLRNNARINPETFTTAENVTLKAEWDIYKYTVKFTNLPDTLTDLTITGVPHGSTIEEPDYVPTRPGNRFVGWNDITASPIVLWNFSNPVTKNLILNAGFEFGSSVIAETLQPLGIHPNPAANVVYVDNAGLKEGDKIVVFNLMGVLVAVYEAGAGEYTTCNVAHLVQGTYIIKAADKAAKMVKK
jgi:hypothetical protein